MQKCGVPLFLEKPWIWLIFSCYYFVPIHYMDMSNVKIIFLVLAYFSFVFAFLWAAKIRGDGGAWQPIALLLLLAIIVVPVSPGASTFFTYVGFFVGFYYSTRNYLLIIGAIIAIIVSMHFYYSWPVPFFALPALTGVISMSIWGYIEKIRITSIRKWLQSREEIEQLAIIAERERIARDLHDILGHTLSSVALKAELAEKLLSQQKIPEASQHLAELHKIARDSLSLVRQTVSGYKHRGLSGEVVQLCEKLRQNGFSVDLQGDIPNVSPRAETALILALTELTTNVLRHSKGNHCSIYFSVDKNEISISMHDNGAVSSLTPGNGLTGIQERLHALAGDLKTQLKNGCRFDIVLPKHEILPSQEILPTQEIAQVQSA